MRRWDWRTRGLVFLVNLSVCASVGLIGGAASAWYMMEQGSVLSTRRQGPWQHWFAAGRPDADPYTRANIARSGRLPIASGNGGYHVASTDQNGQRLIGACDYLIEGRGPAALWWSLAAYDANGQLFKNPAERYAYNSTTVMRGSNGGYAIALSRSAHPGNWLPVTGTGAISLVLEVYEPRRDTEPGAIAPEHQPPAATQTGAPQSSPAPGASDLPTVQRSGCR